MTRIPTRTTVLMVLTLGAFAWFYWQTHRRPTPFALEVDVTLDGGAR